MDRTDSIDFELALISAKARTGLSDGEIADAIGVARQTFWRWRRGDHQPQPSNVQSILELSRNGKDEVITKEHQAEARTFLDDLRFTYGLTQTQIWKLTGLPVKTLQCIRNDRPPHLSTIRRIILAKRHFLLRLEQGRPVEDIIAKAYTLRTGDTVKVG